MHYRPNVPLLRTLAQIYVDYGQVCPPAPVEVEFVPYGSVHWFGNATYKAGSLRLQMRDDLLWAHYVENGEFTKTFFHECGHLVTTTPRREFAQEGHDLSNVHTLSSAPAIWPGSVEEWRQHLTEYMLNNERLADEWAAQHQAEFEQRHGSFERIALLDYGPGRQQELEREHIRRAMKIWGW